MDKLAPQNGWFFIRFLKLSSTIVGWLIILPPTVAWYIMGYESDPLPYYNDQKEQLLLFYTKLKPLLRLLFSFIDNILIPPSLHPAFY